MTKSDLVEKRDNLLVRIEANRCRRPRGESDNRYYDDCVDAVWGLFYANLRRLGEVA